MARCSRTYHRWYTLDKAPQHRSNMIRDLVERTEGVELIFLPTAVPDLSAIEVILEATKNECT